MTLLQRRPGRQAGREVSAMAYDNSPDSEFDPEMERILREHFDDESPDLNAPNDPWPWLESRMEEPPMPSFFSRLLGFLNPMRDGRLSPAFAVAGVAVVAVAVAAVVWAVSGSGGRESPDGLAVAPVTEAPASTARSTAIAMARATATAGAMARTDHRASGLKDPGPTG